MGIGVCREIGTAVRLRTDGGGGSYVCAPRSRLVPRSLGGGGSERLSFMGSDERARPLVFRTAGGRREVDVPVSRRELLAGDGEVLVSTETSRSSWRMSICLETRCLSIRKTRTHPPHREHHY